MVVLFTNIVLGQCTVPMLRVLKIRRGLGGSGGEEEEESDDEEAIGHVSLGHLSPHQSPPRESRGVRLEAESWAGVQGHLEGEGQERGGSISRSRVGGVRLQTFEGRRGGGGRYSLRQLWRRVDEMYVKPVVGGRCRGAGGRREREREKERTREERGRYVRQVDSLDEEQEVDEEGAVARSLDEGRMGCVRGDERDEGRGVSPRGEGEGWVSGKEARISPKSYRMVRLPHRVRVGEEGGNGGEGGGGQSGGGAGPGAALDTRMQRRDAHTNGERREEEERGEGDEEGEIRRG
jgi:hypothetical protein